MTLISKIKVLEKMSPYECLSSGGCQEKFSFECMCACVFVCVCK
jgi:hypothetical protein